MAGGKSKTAAGPVREDGAIVKPWTDRVAVALCYPNRYRVAMGSLGFHQVYHLLNLHDRLVCERAVLPDRGEPRTIESGRRLRDFELIAFSISYEEDLLNLAAMFSAAGIPLDPAQRAERNAPLILAGGVLAFLNPEPLAPLTDAVAVGEAEAILPGLIEALLEARTKPRRELLGRLAAVPGVYVPSLYQITYEPDGRIARRLPLADQAPDQVAHLVCSDLGRDPARTRVFTEDAEFSELALVELGRGCPHGCRFCAGSYLYRPPRWTPAAAVEAALAEGLERRQRAGLLAASVTGHPEFGRIRAWLRARGAGYSLASLRLDEVTPELVTELRAGGAKTLTLAPEAGSERLRRIVNKDLSDRQVETALETAGAAGFRRIKLYFQVGLPGENDDDLAAIPALLARGKAALARGGGGRDWAAAVAVSVNPFVPKPATPFQWAPMAAPEALKKKLGYLQREIARLGGIAFGGTAPGSALLQGWIARGDRRVGAAVAEATRRGLRGRELLRLELPGLPPAAWYLHRERGRDELLPWDFIVHGCDRDELRREYRRAAQGRLTPPCRPGSCRRCPACPE